MAGQNPSRQETFCVVGHWVAHKRPHLERGMLSAQADTYLQALGYRVGASGANAWLADEALLWLTR